MGFDSLADDTVIEIASFLKRKSICRLSMTSQRMYRLTHEASRLKMLALEELPQESKEYLYDANQVLNLNLNKLFYFLETNPDYIKRCTPLAIKALAEPKDVFLATQSDIDKQEKIDSAINLVRFAKQAQFVFESLTCLCPSKEIFLSYRNDKSYHLLHFAAWRRDDLLKQCVEEFAIQTDELTQLLTNDNRNLLDCAAMEGYQDTIQYLMQTHGFNPQQKRAHGNSPPISPVQLAIQYRHNTSCLFKIDKNNNLSCRRSLFTEDDSSLPSI